MASQQLHSSLSLILLVFPLNLWALPSTLTHPPQGRLSPILYANSLGHPKITSIFYFTRQTSYQKGLAMKIKSVNCGLLDSSFLSRSGPSSLYSTTIQLTKSTLQNWRNILINCLDSNNSDRVLSPMKKKLTCSLFLYSSVVISFLITCAAVDTLTVDQVIRDGDTLVSDDEMYQLGFFSPGRNRNRFFGIWYNNISPLTTVWVANRETPIPDLSGVFALRANGLLVVTDSNSTIVWSSNTSFVSPTARFPVAQLLNSGNLVVRGNGSEESYIWQSFDFPGDTFLAGMKFGKDLISGFDRRWTSWRSIDDPSLGEYVVYMNTNGFPQFFEEQGSRAASRSGPWNGLTLNGWPENDPYSLITHEFIFNDTEVYYVFAVVDSSSRSYFYMNPKGVFIQRNWNNRTQAWDTYWEVNPDTCSQFGFCGPNGMCTQSNSPVCSCMKGFEPQNPDEWSVSRWSSGCKRRTPLHCPNGDDFRVVKNVKLPDTRRSWYNKIMTLDQCASACKNNCSCTAYANIDVTTGSGCLLWFGDLLDVRAVDKSQDLHVRMALADLTKYNTPESSSNKTRAKTIVAVSLSSCFVMAILILAIIYAWRKKSRHLHRRQDKDTLTIDEEYNMENEYDDDDTELSYFHLTEISNSTKDFSNTMKLGEGGFGSVYMGVLDDGREIAVKRLSKTSRQGVNEFKNELTFIAKLQHRNLVKLLGYCKEGAESMLIYEYMPNKSLDLFIFDPIRSLALDWADRFQIIHGIARGLLYLHYDSRFKIIHRDLKASNILLDAEMNPKISDFGLARMFRDHENEANTNMVVGTLGYIAPEFAIDGKFSEKSDVFSFGVLVLEIVSGKKNKGFSQEKDSDNLSDSLLAHAWRLHDDNKAFDLLSAHMRESCIEFQVLRTIHIGLLCVQHHVKDRPTMSSVLLMFDQDGELPPPKQPGFFAKDIIPNVNPISFNEITMTTFEPR